MAYDYMFDQLKAKVNKQIIRKLEVAPVSMTDGISDIYLKLRDDSM